MTAEEYIDCYYDYLWTWDSEGEIIAITKGNTIAYTKFIAETLRIIGHNSAPRFSSLLIALAVTDNYGDRENFLRIKEIFQRYLPKTDLKDAFEFISELAYLPAQYKKGKNRQLLLNTLFWQSHNGISSKKTKQVILKLNKIANGDEFPQILDVRAPNDLILKDILVFEFLQRKFKNGEGLIKAMADLPHDVPEIEIDEKPIETPAKPNEEPVNYIDKLCNDYKTYKVGNLVKSIWSGLNIPYHSIQPSTQPLGGVADISNKGDFHQLLISEFANDDLTFISRLANNEALYLEREVPPENNPYERIFLIDTSIRNWGTPKTVALAVSIAIAEHPKNNFKCTTIMMGSNNEPYSLKTIQEVITAQSEFNSAIHSADALVDFFKSHDKNDNRQIFYIGAKDGLRHDAINRALSEYRQYINYKIILDQTGGISVYKTQGVSQRHIQDFNLNLNKLWQKVPKPNTNTNNHKNEDGNDIENWIPPILVDVSINTLKWKITNEEAYFQFAKNHFYKHYGDYKKTYLKGFEFIGTMPHSMHFEVGITTQNEVVLLSYLAQNKKIVINNYSTGNSTEIVFPYFSRRRNVHSQPFGEFAFYNDAFYFTGSNGWKIDLKGNIRADNSFEPTLLPNRLKIYEGITYPPSARTASVLKNLKRVFINKRNNLVLNNHEFSFSNSNTIKFKTNKVDGAIKEAANLKPNYFQFENGSVVYLNNAGFVIFMPINRSSSFFAPSTLDQNIGVGSEVFFAGDEYFLKADLPAIKYSSKNGEMSTKLIEVLRRYTDKNQAKTEYPVVSYENRITFYDLKDAQKAYYEMKPYCITLESFHLNESIRNQKVIPTQKFYSEFVFPFIDDILKYGTKA
jgi:hypothetical protein